MVYYRQAKEQYKIKYLEGYKMKNLNVVKSWVYKNVLIWKMSDGQHIIEGDRTKGRYSTLAEAKKNISNSIWAR